MNKRECFYREIAKSQRRDNCQRPQDFLDLLEEAKDIIKEMIETFERSDGKQPFIIDDVVVDLYNGMIAIYFNLNE